MQDIQAEWFNEEVTLDETTLADFEKYVAEYLEVRAEADTLEAELAVVNKKMGAMQEKLIAFLDAQEKSKHVTALGTINVIDKTTWRPPEGVERQEILERLRELDAYDAVMAFNAAKFSAWYAQERDANAEFNLPGVEQKVTRYIRFQRKRG